MIDPLTIAEVLKKDRDGTAYEELERELNKLQALRDENSRLRDIIEDFKSETPVFKNVIKFANLLSRIHRGEREWRTIYGLIYENSFSTPHRGGSQEESELISSEILEIANAISLGSDFWINEEMTGKFEKKLRNLAKDYERYMQKIERAETRWVEAMREITLQEHNLYKIKNMGFWSRLKWLFKGN